MESSPFGVLFCVEPWNFPFYQLARVAGPQLMAGNVLVVKHAGCVPQCAIAFEKLLLDAGAPVGAYTNLLISHEQANHVVDDPRIKGVALTGSVAAGRSIAARAGQNLKKSSMELGGSDAFIVLDDADLEKTIPWAVWGRMYNGGQTCCAAKRFIVLDSIADKFLAKFKTALETLKPGDPMVETTTHGPLSTEAALLQLLKQVDSAVAHGARLVMGGKRIDRPGSFMQTTILTDIQPDNPAFRDEFFGPVDTPLGDREPEAEASSVLPDLDKGLEQILDRFGIEPAAAVFHVDQHPVACGIGAQRHRRVGVCELEGVLQQIGDRPQQEAAVRADGQKRIDRGHRERATSGAGVQG
jgi:succinate-semialdehyde dehydrogenase/glutarate-semialdehyde dehydrogenase